MTMTERQQEREREACYTSNQGSVRERQRESDNDRKATRQRDMQHTSNQVRKKDRERVTMTER